jgi:CRP-like cAMP-binding protein
VNALKETPIPITNRLLAALPRDEYERLFPHAHFIRLPRNRIVYETGDEVRHAYFLNNGMASFLAITEDGQTVDICTIGNEGFIGVPIVLAVPIMPCRVVTQLPSDALMIKSEPLLVEFNRGETLQQLLLKYAYAHQAQVIQSSICHSLHTIRQRLCRWLLVVSDSVQSESFEVTQEHIANMLGHQRNRITLSARELLQQGLIEYGGGNMRILHRVGLETAACECYRVIRESLTNVMADDRGAVKQ